MTEPNSRMIDLNQVAQRRGEPDLVLAYTEDLRQCDIANPGRAGLLQVWMRALTGKDDRDLLNHQIKHGRKGRAKFAPVGNSAAFRLQRAVLEIRSQGAILAIGSEPVTKVTPDVYDRLPGWMIAAMRRCLAELSGELEDDLDDDVDEDDEDDDDSDGVNAPGE